MQFRSVNNEVSKLRPTITLNEVLQVIFNRSGNYQEPFCITTVTADKTRNTGGKELVLTNMIVPTIERMELQGMERSFNPEERINSNHKQHGTINLINTESRRPAKIHIDLILEFNGKIVL